MQLESLNEHGFHVKQGIAYCVGDEEIYVEVLRTALEEGREKIPFIRECVQKEDYDRYCIEVHGLKNAAKQIGAQDLSDMAYVQEMAARTGNTKQIRESGEALLTAYQKILDTLESFLADRQ